MKEAIRKVVLLYAKHSQTVNGLLFAGMLLALIIAVGLQQR